MLVDAFAPTHVNKLVLTAMIATMLGIMAGLAGCQTTLKPTYKTSSQAQPMAVSKSILNDNTQSTLGCIGLFHCEINSINHTPVISPLNHAPVQQPMPANFAVQLLPSQTSNLQAETHFPNYLAKFASGQHMVTMRYYLDDKLNTFESFSFIHPFIAGHNYQLRAYRKVQNTGYSLLSQSAPTPLCIDLSDNDQLTNRWCKKPNQQGALSNEFIKMAF